MRGLIIVLEFFLDLADDFRRKFFDPILALKLTITTMSRSGPTLQ